MEGMINIAGVATALVCSFLLYRGYRRTGARLLCWGAVCFLALAMENGILFADLYVFPDLNLSVLRYMIALSGLISLIFGLIWEVH